MTPMEQVEAMAAGGEELLLCEGFEGALLGVQQTFEKGGITYRTLYSLRKCVDILRADGSSYESALEHLQFNTLGAYVGKATPSFLLDLEVEEEG